MVYFRFKEKGIELAVCGIHGVIGLSCKMLQALAMVCILHSALQRRQKGHEGSLGRVSGVGRPAIRPFGHIQPAEILHVNLMPELSTVNAVRVQYTTQYTTRYIPQYTIRYIPQYTTRYIPQYTTRYIPQYTTQYIQYMVHGITWVRCR